MTLITLQQATDVNVLIERYFLSFAECKHGMKPSNCAACKPPALTGFQHWLLMRGYPIKVSDGLTLEWRVELEEEYRSDLMRYFARNKVEHFNPEAYANPAHSSTTTAQSFSRKPLRLGGDDRVLSDQHKFGTRSERASQKHHEINDKGKKELRKYYGYNERKFTR